MENTQFGENTGQPFIAQQKTFMQRYAYGIKAILIGFLVLFLLIPATMTMGLISDREKLQNDATSEVSAKWGDEQTVVGPVLIVPYKNDSGKVNNAVFLPEKLNVNGQLLPEIRHRGIYEVALYNSQMQISGSFPTLDLASLNIRPENVFLSDAYLVMGITDMRGISNQAAVQWNGQNYFFNPGTSAPTLMPNGMRVRVPVTLTDSGSFSIKLELRGSGHLSFSPVGRTTTVAINSPWPSPGFDGAFLPKEHQENDKGFNASWQVSQLNRSFPQSWTNNDYDLHTADFGVKLYLPADGYQQSTRAVKYAILIIGLTFLVFYFIELLQRTAIHPLQYILIGLALVIFYTLLIALSEQLNFRLAYLIASVLTIGLVTGYTGSVMKRFGVSAWIGGTLTILYGFIYVIIRSEDQALLMGSLGLFIILAVVMYFSRKIKWGELS
jgi:inner membrane protein